MSALEIGTMTPADLATTLEWAAAEGWNPGRDDAAAFLAADADGFLMGRIDGAPATAISVVAYGPAFGFLGLYLCKPEFRGRGHGLATWRAGLARLGDRTVGLDGVVAQQANYVRSGFALAYRNIRFGGRATAGSLRDSHIVEIAASPNASLIEGVVAYDRALFPGPRDAFIRRWIAPPGRLSFAWVSDGEVRGYGSIRACQDGCKVGPLFADSPAIADALFMALASRHSGQPVFLDVAEPNAPAQSLAVRHGLAPCFETARMYRGAAPAEPLARIYGVTTFELG